MRALVFHSVVFLFSLPLRLARAWYSVTVSKRREGEYIPFTEENRVSFGDASLKTKDARDQEIV